MVNTRKKHHFAAWSDDRTNLSGLAKVTLQPGETHSHCTACGINVKMGTSGGVKFWFDGKWSSKRPPCQTANQS